MWFGIVSLFPSMFNALNVGITGRALKQGSIQIAHWNPRTYTTDIHQSVDDRPYGGGPGMVMMVEPLQSAIQAAKTAAPKQPTIIYLSPQGKQFNQEAAAAFAATQALIFVAGRYEGIDERLIQQEIHQEWSIGDYVLTGGELAAMVMIDAITRLIPGVVGDNNSISQDSISSGLLKHPQYTRPEYLESAPPIPDVLLTGNHKLIEQWRLKQSLGRTWLKRPDLLSKKHLTKEESALLAAFIEEYSRK